MTKKVFSYTIDKEGSMLTVKQPATHWKITFELDIGHGVMFGRNEDDEMGPDSKLHIRSLEDIDGMMKMLTIMRNAITQNRPNERPDDFY